MRNARRVTIATTYSSNFTLALFWTAFPRTGDSKCRSNVLSHSSRKLLDPAANFIKQCTNCRNLSDSHPDLAIVAVYGNPTVETFDDVIKFNPSKAKRLIVKVNEYVVLQMYSDWY